MTVPAATAKELGSLSTSEDAILLVIFYPPDDAEPLRFASQGPEIVYEDDGPRFGVTSDGEWYDHAIMQEAPLPDDRENDPGSATLLFENVERDMGALVDEEIEECSADLVVVAKSDPDQILDEVRGYAVLSAEAGDESLTLEVGFEPIAAEPCPAWRMNKANDPGLFR